MNKNAPQIMIGLLLLWALLAAGCAMQQRVVEPSPWVKLFAQSEWADRPANGSKSSKVAGLYNRRYTIQLKQYSGPGAQQNLSRVMLSAQREAGLSNLWYSTGSDKTTIYMGRFKGKKTRQAKTALKQAHAAEIGGEKIFSDAKIVKIGDGQDAVLDTRDLRSLKGKGLFALQIGYYDGGYGPDFRRAAEQAVDALREQEQEAYYYHGPNRSMVLLNSWTYKEAFILVGQVDRYSNAVRITQEKYPHNIPNGRPFQPGDDPEYIDSQHSFLVPIR